ncbi:MAG: hypothetical protein U0930_09105 [Pirellulales bacterium]
MGAAVPKEAFPDSQNVSAALLGEANGKGREKLVVQDNGSSGTFGYRSGKWKLLRHDKKQAYNLIVEQPLGNTKVPQYQLFNLEADPGERNDLMDKEPDLAKQLIAELEQITHNTTSKN